MPLQTTIHNLTFLIHTLNGIRSEIHSILSHSVVGFGE